MTCSFVKALDVLRQLKSSPELSPLDYSAVLAPPNNPLTVVLESFVKMELEYDALDADLISMTAFLASGKAEHLPMNALAAELQDVVAVERMVPKAEKALADLWEVGPYIRPLVSMISSWLPVHQEFLQPDGISLEMARIRLRQYDVVQRMKVMRRLLEGLEALASLGRAIGAINLESWHVRRHITTL